MSAKNKTLCSIARFAAVAGKKALSEEEKKFSKTQLKKFEARRCAGASVENVACFDGANAICKQRKNCVKNENFSSLKDGLIRRRLRRRRGGSRSASPPLRL